MLPGGSLVFDNATSTESMTNKSTHISFGLLNSSGAVYKSLSVLLVPASTLNPAGKEIGQEGNGGVIQLRMR